MIITRQELPIVKKAYGECMRSYCQYELGAESKELLEDIQLICCRVAGIAVVESRKEAMRENGVTDHED